MLRNVKNWAICLGSVWIRVCLSREKRDQKIACAWLRFRVSLDAILVSALSYSLLKNVNEYTKARVALLKNSHFKYNTGGASTE